MLDSLLHNPYFFYSVVLVTTILSTSFGVGTGTILIPLAALQFGPKEGVGLLAIFWLYQNINKLTIFHKHIHWSVVWRVIMWSLPGVLIGSIALTLIPTELFKKLLAVAMLCYLASDLLRLIPKHAGEAMLPPLSFLYGFLSGFLGSGNIVKGPMFTSLGLLKESYIATYAFTSMFMNIPKIVTLSIAGIISVPLFLASIPLFVISFIGTRIGKKVLTVVPENVFYYLVMASFVLAAVALLIE